MGLGKGSHVSFGVKSKEMNMLNGRRNAREEEYTQKVVVQARNYQWSKPPEGWVKFNVDATCRRGGNMWG